jgi:thiol-disulfide isomerase/thioredoxin
MKIIVGLVVLILVLVYILLSSNEEKESLEIEPKKKVVKMFYAPWCGACKSTMPTWDELAKKHKNMIKIDCEASPAAAKDNNIKHFPTIRSYDENGKMIAEHTGSRSKESLEKFVTLVSV